jgi:very-short-patch-repair endonuclease
MSLALYTPSPLWGEGRVRGQVGRGETRTGVVCESPRELKVIIELDGGQHAVQTRADAERTALLEALGYCVLRFWNNDTLGNTEGVLQRIALALAVRPSPRPSPRRGEGEGRA